MYDIDFFIIIPHLPLQQKSRIEDDEDGTGIVDKRSGHGIQDARHGQHDSCEVQAHGKRQIIADGLHHMLGEGKEMRQFLDFIIDKGNIGRIDGDVTANTAHRDADARSLEGRGIVDAIANHADRQRRFFHLPYGRKLCLGQTGGFDVPYANNFSSPSQINLPYFISAASLQYTYRGISYSAFIIPIRVYVCQEK